MSKRSTKPNPIEQYDRFMSGAKTPATFRGVVHLVGAFMGNSVLWLTGMITIARLGIVLAFVLMAAVTLGIIQRINPTLDLQLLFLISGMVSLIITTIGVIILKLILRRDAQRMGNKPTFGVFDDDARSRSKQNYRRKSGR